MGISSETSFSYPQTIHVEAEEWVQRSLILSPVPTLRRKKGTREVCSCPLCPRCGGRRVQRSLPLSPVPTLRRKKGTEKLAPVICAHTAAEEGYREACPCPLCPRCGGKMGTGGICPVYGAPTLRAMHPIHKCVAKGALHLFH